MAIMEKQLTYMPGTYAYDLTLGTQKAEGRLKETKRS